MSSTVITSVKKTRRPKTVRRTVSNTITAGAVVLVAMYTFNAGLNFGKKNS